MFVLTIDRRASRRDRAGLDMGAERDRLQRDLPCPVLDWDVNAGDELQALYDDDDAALAAVPDSRVFAFTAHTDVTFETVEYRSVEELQAAIRTVEAEIARNNGASPKRQIRVTTAKGF